MADSSVANHSLTKSAKTRDRILDVAARMFRHKGYTDTSVNEISAAAGIRAASIYYHFRSKDEILEEVLNRGTLRVFDAVRGAVEALGPAARPRERLATAVRTHLMILHENEDYTSANVRVFPQAPKPIVRRHMKVRRAYGNYWIELLSAAREAGEIRRSTDLGMSLMLLLGALNWSIQWFDPKDQDLALLTRSATSLLLDGLLDKPERAL